MSNKPVPTHRFNSILALMKAARKYMTHLSGLSKRKSLDRYCDEMDGGMRGLVAHPAVFLFGGAGVGWALCSAHATGFSAMTADFSGTRGIFSAVHLFSAIHPNISGAGALFSARSTIFSGACTIFSAAHLFSAIHANISGAGAMLSARTTIFSATRGNFSAGHLFSAIHANIRGAAALAGDG